ncbi:MAG: hypothetical protein EBY38_07370 [Flavobacteriaceae bacterium]|nr:hypothetical protein [Flavobacteriaceae bacterium]
MRIVRATYQKKGEELQRVVYGTTRNQVLQKVKQRLEIDEYGFRWRKNVKLELDLLHFEPNGRGIIKALEKGFRDSMDYAE